jgi:2-polyprenyl-3-methyl-5-hydroxy-6-metoxy-1,4-benzoquinol methylase
LHRVHAYLLQVRELTRVDYMDWLTSRVPGRSCLDIGAVEYDLAYSERPTWKHARLVEAAERVVGIDLVEGAVEVLRGRGYDIRVYDATSDADVGERFDVVVIGDVIEHVANPERLLRFAVRHLADGGEVIVRTPNPYYTDHIKKFGRDRPFVNLDHIAWYTPTMALEFARRADCVLRGYVVDVSEMPRLRRWANPEMYSRNFIFRFGR